MALERPPALRRAIAWSALLVAALTLSACGAGDVARGSFKAPWHHAVVSADGRTVTVTYPRGKGCHETDRAVADTTSSTVEITVISTADSDCVQGGSTPAQLAVHLSTPLDGRRLVDGICDPRHGSNGTSCANG